MICDKAPGWPDEMPHAFFRIALQWQDD